MPDIDLRDLNVLKQACEDAEKEARNKERYPVWGKELIEVLEYVRGADLETRSSEEFHKRIWEDNPVSAVGMGTVTIDKAIQDAEFRKWVAEMSLKPLPDSQEARVAALTAPTKRNILSSISKRLKSFDTVTNPTFTHLLNSHGGIIKKYWRLVLVPVQTFCNLSGQEQRPTELTSHKRRLTTSPGD